MTKRIELRQPPRKKRSPQAGRTTPTATANRQYAQQQRQASAQNYLENLILLRDTKPAEYNLYIDAALKAAVEVYEQHKAAMTAA